MPFTKVCLVASNTVTSANVALGFGRATSTIDPADLPALGVLRLINASLSIIGVIWSKTSFGVTLLRLVGGKTRMFVIFLLVTSNMFFGASVAFGWLQCVSFLDIARSSEWALHQEANHTNRIPSTKTGSLRKQVHVWNPRFEYDLILWAECIRESWTSCWPSCPGEF